MAQPNNQTYLNWLDYITDKFPPGQFNINIEEFPEEKTDTITVTLKDGSSRKHGRYSVTLISKTN